MIHFGRRFKKLKIRNLLVKKKHQKISLIHEIDLAKSRDVSDYFLANAILSEY